MLRGHYDSEALERSLLSMEERYGMTSEAFYEALERDDAVKLARIPGFARHIWASIYRERRDEGDDFAARVERTLELV